MKQDKRFKVVSNKDWCVSEQLLFSVYIPIIKMDTMTFYKSLITYNNDGKLYNLASFIHNNNLTENDFWTHLHKLESLNLISTFKQTKEDENTYFIKLNNTLSFEEIMSNEDFVQLLEMSLNEYDLNHAKEKFSNLDFLKKLSDVSWTMRETFNFGKKKQTVFHLNEIKQRVFEITNISIDISNRVYDYLKYIFSNYNWSYEKIAKLLSKCIVDIKTSPHISYVLMVSNFEEKINPRSSEYIDSPNTNAKKFKNNLNIDIEINQLQYAELHRCEEIYEKDTNLEDFQDVLNDLKFYDSLKYVSSIHKQILSDEYVLLIENLQEKYNFSDAIINVLFDFCNWKNKGFFSSQYINKIASTAYSRNIKTVEEMIEHLKRAKQHSNSIRIKTKKEKSEISQPMIFDNDNENDDGFN